MPGSGPALVVGTAALVVAAAVLALGTAIVLPFETDTIVSLSGDRLVATHYGLYNTVWGVGILLGNLGNLGTGWVLGLARESGLTRVPWLALLAIGLGCAVAPRTLRQWGSCPAEAAFAAQRWAAHRVRRGRDVLNLGPRSASRAARNCSPRAPASLRGARDEGAASRRGPQPPIRVAASTGRPAAASRPWRRRPFGPDRVFGILENRTSWNRLRIPPVAG